MIFLILSILSNTGIVVLFRTIKDKDVELINVIVLNYFVAAFAGFVIANFNHQLEGVSVITVVEASWFPAALFVGTMFVVMFYLIGLSSSKAGITKTTIATKMSVVLPILFSVFYYSEQISIIKIGGLLLGLFAVYLTVVPKQSNSSNRNFILPIILFLGAGILDIVIKHTQEAYLDDTSLPIFSSSLFFISFITSVVLALIKQKDIFKRFNRSTVFYGVVLGLINLGSVFFLISALDLSGMDSSVLFGINNVSIVLVATGVGAFAFSEILTNRNRLGIALSIIALLLLSNIKMIERLW